MNEFEAKLLIRIREAIDGAKITEVREIINQIVAYSVNKTFQLGVEMGNPLGGFTARLAYYDGTEKKKFIFAGHMNGDIEIIESDPVSSKCTVESSDKKSNLNESTIKMLLFKYLSNAQIIKNNEVRIQQYEEQIKSCKTNINQLKEEIKALESDLNINLQKLYTDNIFKASMEDVRTEFKIDIPDSKKGLEKVEV